MWWWWWGRQKEREKKRKRKREQEWCQSSFKNGVAVTAHLEPSWQRVMVLVMQSLRGLVNILGIFQAGSSMHMAGILWTGLVMVQGRALGNVTLNVKAGRGWGWKDGRNQTWRVGSVRKYKNLSWCVLEIQRAECFWDTVINCGTGSRLVKENNAMSNRPKGSWQSW